MRNLFHYTTINTLALILKSKKIRFNRLDRVDDVSESSAFIKHNLAKNLFVSCWTEQTEESIPQWHMYTDKMQGVRISFGKQLFNYQPLDPNHPLIRKGGKLYSPIPFEMMFNDSFIIPPIFLDREYFARKIVYVENPSDYLKDIVQEKQTGSGRVELSIAMPNLGIYKKKEWEFQEEFRFVLFILPGTKIPNGNLMDPLYINEMPTNLIHFIRNQTPPPIECFDVELHDEAFDNLEVTLGPLCTESHRIMVESLLGIYAPNAAIKNSVLRGTIKKPIR